MALTPFYVSVNASTMLLLNLDAQIYDTDVATACGLTKTEPADNIAVIPVTQKIARNSNQVARAMAVAIRGKKRRQVPLICDREKFAGLNAALAGKTFTLGNGVGASWTIQRVKGA
jgi:hypothetical protein